MRRTTSFGSMTPGLGAKLRWLRSHRSFGSSARIRRIRPWLQGSSQAKTSNENRKPGNYLHGKAIFAECKCLESLWWLYDDFMMIWICIGVLLTLCSGMLGASPKSELCPHCQLLAAGEANVEVLQHRPGYRAAGSLPSSPRCHETRSHGNKTPC